MNKKTLLFFCFLYCLLFVLLYPWYQYVFDMDAPGYIKVAERIAQGDYANSINGCWSPLNSWLLVPFLNAGANAVVSAKILDGIFGLLTLISLYYLLKKLVLDKFVFVCIIAVLVIILLHFAFNQLFGDLLQVLIMSAYLNIICSTDFRSSNKKIILSSIICGVAYYAKYYSLYFGLIYIAAILFFLLRDEHQKFPIKTWFIKTIIAWSVLLFMVLPWAFAIKSRYGHYGFSTVGKLNETIALSPALPQQKNLFLDWPYPDSYSNWDDPSFLSHATITPFTSKTVFLFQLKLILSNIQSLVHFLNDFSCATILVFLLSVLLYYLNDKEFVQNKNNGLLLLAAMIMPLGYFLFHFEPRYIWIVYLSLFILSGVLFTILNKKNWVSRNVFLISCVLFFSSFCLYPIDQLQNQRYEGKQVYDMAESFKKQNIQGKFISNFSAADEQADLTILAYLLKSQFLATGVTNTEAENLQIIKARKINYYILLYHSSYEKEGILNSLAVKKADAVLPNIYPGVILLSFKQ